MYSALNCHNVAKQAEIYLWYLWLNVVSTGNVVFQEDLTITSMSYLDMLQQFLIPQLDEDDQERRIHLQHTAHPHITLLKCASTSTPVSQVGGLVERRR
jgi:hypothetical protein